jgi:hypothetical protein
VIDDDGEGAVAALVRDLVEADAPEVAESILACQNIRADPADDAFHRLKASLLILATGRSTGLVAPEVGYESASVFVAAFHREVGLTPTAYFRAI